MVIVHQLVHRCPINTYLFRLSFVSTSPFFLMPFVVLPHNIYINNTHVAQINISRARSTSGILSRMLAHLFSLLFENLRLWPNVKNPQDAHPHASFTSTCSSSWLGKYCQIFDELLRRGWNNSCTKPRWQRTWFICSSLCGCHSFT